MLALASDTHLGSPLCMPLSPSLPQDTLLPAGLAASCPSSDQQALCQGAFVSLKAASASPPPAFGPLLPQAPHGVGCLPSAPWTVGLDREQQ